MAGKIEINDSLQSRFSKASKKRKGMRELKAFFLIVCEGEKTEPNYFKSFPITNGSIVFDLTFGGGGISTTKVVEKAIELRDKSILKYDRVWAVFDKDSFLPGNFNKAIIYGKTKDVSCAWSNEAFELWYLLHFVNRITAMSRDEYKKALEREINKKIFAIKGRRSTPFIYQKNDLNMYQTLKTYGSETNAIKWAKALRAEYINEQYAKYNPCTMVYELIEELSGKSKDLLNEINIKYETGE